MNANGWIAIYRDIQRHPVFADAELFKLFIWLVVNATREPKSVSKKIGRGNRIIALERGELCAGRDFIAEALGWPPSTVRNRLDKLVEFGCIENSEDSQKPLIRVVNYGTYQDLAQKTGQPKDSKKDSQSGQPKKRLKRPKNKGEIDFANQREDSQKNEKKDRKQQVTTIIPPISPKGDGECVIPPMLNYPKFIATWDQYKEWIFLKDGKRIDSITEHLRLKILCDRESVRAGKAGDDLILTMTSAERTRTIWDSDRKTNNNTTKPVETDYPMLSGRSM